MLEIPLRTELCVYMFIIEKQEIMTNTKKVLIIGAHGKIGKILTKKLKGHSDFEPTAFIRKEEQKAYFEEMNVPTVIANLEDTVENLTPAFKNFDAVVFAAGSGGKTGLEKTMSIDLDGAAKSVEACEAAGVKRFVMISASHSDDRTFWDKADMKPYYIAKHYADQMLQNSSLDYTILRPVMLTDNEGTGKIIASGSAEKVQEKIAREDVAETIVHVLANDNTIGKIIEISSGEKQVKEALMEMV